MLDLGCGTGVPTAGMLAETGLEVVGIDVSTEMLALARRNVPAGRFVAMDLMELDDSLGRFDAVCAFFSLLMVRREDIPRVLRRVRAVLNPGGVVAIGMVEGDFDYAPLPFLGQQVSVTAYPQADLEAAIRAEGLHVLEVDVEEFEPAVGGDAGRAADLPVLLGPLRAAHEVRLRAYGGIPPMSYAGRAQRP